MLAMFFFFEHRKLNAEEWLSAVVCEGWLNSELVLAGQDLKSSTERKCWGLKQ